MPPTYQGHGSQSASINDLTKATETSAAPTGYPTPQTTATAAAGYPTQFVGPTLAYNPQQGYALHSIYPQVSNGIALLMFPHCM